MAELKTKVNDASVDAFLNIVADVKKRNDCYAIIKLMSDVTKQPPKMWGPAIIGFGSYHYKYESGREGDMCAVGFSPRKANITLYLMGAVQGHPELLQKLGKHKTGKGCLYLNTLDDIDTGVLKQMIKASLDYLKETYGMKAVA
jgi:hypothetical protein